LVVFTVMVAAWAAAALISAIAATTTSAGEQKKRLAGRISHPGRVLEIASPRGSSAIRSPLKDGITEPSLHLTLRLGPVAAGPGAWFYQSRSIRDHHGAVVAAEPRIAVVGQKNLSINTAKCKKIKTCLCNEQLNLIPDRKRQAVLQGLTIMNVRPFNE
jgi:hypothetical protein